MLLRRFFHIDSANSIIQLRKLTQAGSIDLTSHEALLSSIKEHISSKENSVFLQEFTTIPDLWKVLNADPSLEELLLEKIVNDKEYSKIRTFASLMLRGCVFPVLYSSKFSGSIVNYYSPKVQTLTPQYLAKLAGFMKSQNCFDWMCVDSMAKRFMNENFYLGDLISFILKTYRSNPITFELEAFAKEKIRANISSMRLGDDCWQELISVSTCSLTSNSCRSSMLTPS
mmetsp:Transcript_9017/g.17388  ORF Transcript_9017/g.17388 Transcript_9017/m.17388 type:complete len:228 (+) Transcript_9017:3-686(+)